MSSAVGSITLHSFKVLNGPESEESNIELILATRPRLMKDITYTLLTCNVNIVNINMYVEDSAEGCKSVYNLVLTDTRTGGPLSAKTIQDFEELLKRPVPIYPAVLHKATLAASSEDNKDK